MDAIKGCFSCNFRKRTLINRVLPIMLQIFVIVGVWQVFKSQSLPLQEGDGAVGRSLRYARLPACSPGDYTTVQNLRLEKILSRSSVPDQSQVYLLNVEILIRDAEQGTLILYPAGTEVTFDQSKMKISDNAENAGIIEYDESNSDDYINLGDDGNVDSQKEENVQEPGGEIEMKAEGLAETNQAPGQDNKDFPQDMKEKEKTALENAPEETFYVDYPELGEEGIREEHAIDEMLVNDQMLRISPEKQRGQQTILDQMEDKDQGQLDFNQQKQMAGYNVFQMGQNKAGHNQIGLNQMDQNQMLQNQMSQNQMGQNQMGQNQMGQNQMGQNRMGQNQMAQNQMGQNQMGQNQMRQNQMGQNQMRQNQMGQNQMRQNQMGQNQMGQNQMGAFMNENIQTQQGAQYQPVMGSTAQARQDFSSSLSQTGQSQRGLPSQPIGQKLDGNFLLSDRDIQQTNMAQEILRQPENPPTKNTMQGQGVELGHQNQQILSGGQQRTAQTSGVAFPQVPTIEDETLLYADGFADRVKKFKTELYGKMPNDTKFQGARTSNMYSLINPQACQGFEHIDVLFVINSLPQSDEQRQRIRNTFVDSSYFKSATIIHIFLVGKTLSRNFQSNLNREHEKYGDVVQGDFLDVPENGTLKGIWGMKWVKHFCPKVKFIMKIDDDVFVDSDKLIRGLIPAASKVTDNRAMFCIFNPQGPIPRVGPNAFRQDQFPGRTFLRPYCKGSAILMTQSVISSLASASEHVPLFDNLSDLYLYGILPFVVGGVQVYDLGNKRAFHDFGSEVLDCYTDNVDKCQFVASKVSSGQFTSLWNFVMVREQETHKGWEGSNSLWNMKSFIRNF